MLHLKLNIIGFGYAEVSTRRFNRHLITQPKTNLIDMTRYGISAVRYCPRNNRIEKVKAHLMSTDDVLSKLNVYTRNAVIKAVEDYDISFVTLPPAHDGKFTVGPEVVLVEIANEMFIKTSVNQTQDDNLGELPEF